MHPFTAQLKLQMHELRRTIEKAVTRDACSGSSRRPEWRASGPQKGICS